MTFLLGFVISFSGLFVFYTVDSEQTSGTEDCRNQEKLMKLNGGGEEFDCGDAELKVPSHVCPDKSDPVEIRNIPERCDRKKMEVEWETESGVKLTRNGNDVQEGKKLPLTTYQKVMAMADTEKIKQNVQIEATVSGGGNKCEDCGTAKETTDVGCKLEFTGAPSEVKVSETAKLEATYESCEEKSDSESCTMDVTFKNVDANVETEDGDKKLTFYGNSGSENFSITPHEAGEMKVVIDGTGCECGNDKVDINVDAGCEVVLEPDEQIIYPNERAEIRGSVKGVPECCFGKPDNKNSYISILRGSDPNTINKKVDKIQNNDGLYLTNKLNKGTYYYRGFFVSSGNCYENGVCPDPTDNCSGYSVVVHVTKLKITEVEITNTKGNTSLRGEIENTKRLDGDAKLVASDKSTKNNFGRKVIDTTKVVNGKFEFNFDSDNLLPKGGLMKVEVDVGNKLSRSLIVTTSRYNANVAYSTLRYKDGIHSDKAIPGTSPVDVAIVLLSYVAEFRARIISRAGDISFSTTKGDIPQKGHDEFVESRTTSIVATDIKRGQDANEMFSGASYTFNGVTEWKTPDVSPTSTGSSAGFGDIDYSVNVSPDRHLWYDKSAVNYAEVNAYTYSVEKMELVQLEPFSAGFFGLGSGSWEHDMICAELPPSDEHCLNELRNQK